MIRVGYYNPQNVLCCWRECSSKLEAISFCEQFNTRFKHMSARIIETKTGG